MHDFRTIWRRSAVGELCWLTPEGPKGIPVVPLHLDSKPCVALPLAYLAEIDSLPGRAAFCVTTPGVKEPDRPAMVGVGPIDVRIDLDEEWFCGDVVEQEVAKHPPTRLRSASMLARKENWWWTARAVVVLESEETTYEVGTRTTADHALLVHERDSDVRVDVVGAAGWDGGIGDRVELLGGEPNGHGEEALVFGHQASPDFERWERWERTGTLSGRTLALTGSDGTPNPDPRPFRLMERYRNHREVERTCRAGIAAVERRMGR